MSIISFCHGGRLYSESKSKVFDHVYNTYERSAHLSFFSDWARLTPIVILLWGIATPPPQRVCYFPSIEECRYPFKSPG